MQAALAALRGILGKGLLAVCLHGSAVSGGLRPQSDIDLIAVIADDLAADSRRDLVTALSRLSSRHPAAPEGPRCLEVMVFRRADLAGCSDPARAEFVYGEWLRDTFEAGETPGPARNPEQTLVLLTCPGIFPPDAIRVRPNLRTDNEANEIHGRTDYRHPGRA